MQKEIASPAQSKPDPHTHHSCKKGEKGFPLSRNSWQVKAVMPAFANLRLPCSHPTIIAQFAGPRQDLERRGQRWIDSRDWMLPDCHPGPLQLKHKPIRLTAGLTSSGLQSSGKRRNYCLSLAFRERSRLSFLEGSLEAPVQTFQPGQDDPPKVRGPCLGNTRTTFGEVRFHWFHVLQIRHGSHPTSQNRFQTTQGATLTSG